jgi:hypothetical protein
MDRTSNEATFWDYDHEFRETPKIIIIFESGTEKTIQRRNTLIKILVEALSSISQ